MNGLASSRVCIELLSFRLAALNECSRPILLVQTLQGNNSSSAFSSPPHLAFSSLLGSDCAASFSYVAFVSSL